MIFMPVMHSERFSEQMQGNGIVNDDLTSGIKDSLSGSIVKSGAIGFL